MAWHIAQPHATLRDLQQNKLLNLALELHRALTDLRTTDPTLRGTLTLPSIGDMEYSDTAELMVVRSSMNRRLKYPWDVWSNGDLWILHRGADFTVPVHQFQTNIHVFGQNNDRVGVTRKLSDEALALQFQPITEGVAV